ncbi:glycosyltransferase [Desulfofustis glycolicus]|uniref:Glycosyltransferase involved in cell wall bisynthesis n=1 Tax=Desulfofustis glycolicus DSM 9705 TaxID=1121409 RepID=A0A1M5YSF5_9BACT|nr:glycosyltransferase [Desulfofustis glycolicus]SHI14738.1 Glycosyltransferase involved in cell wall bisynthesis [Desulfofustis glycolicus DSM 9705]
MTGTTPSKPMISVIMATYNMGQYVCQAVDSVLDQDYGNLEVIVVDDGSIDDTPLKLKRYASDSRVKLIHQENAGQTTAKNRGLQEAQGEYVGFCDADNFWFPSKLSRQLPLFDNRDKLAVVYGDLQLIDAAGNKMATPAVKRYSGRITGQLLCDNFVSFNTSLTPRRVVEEVGGFDESLRMGIDYDLWLRISVSYEFQYIPEPLVGYRIWGGQMSNRTGERFENSFRMMNNFLARYPRSVTPAEVRRGWAHTYVSRGRWKASEKRYGDALLDYFRAFKYRFYDRRLWKSLIKLGVGSK